MALGRSVTVPCPVDRSLRRGAIGPLYSPYLPKHAAGTYNRGNLDHPRFESWSWRTRTRLSARSIWMAKPSASIFFVALTTLTDLMSIGETRKTVEVGIALGTMAQLLSGPLIKHLQRQRQRSHG